MAGRLILVTGGTGSGRLRIARDLACRLSSRVRVLTFGSPDEEGLLKCGGWNPAVVESPSALACGQRPTDGIGEVLLVSGLDAWVEKELHSAGEMEAVLEAVHSLVAFARARRWPTLIVSREVGSEVVPVSREERLYRDTLGWANQILAQAADEVWLALAGLPFRLK
ncbi:MAG: bifunctional adenosylcobinamide kinase/adenosylcobinamide-phosphate guanylyltransferase [Moorellales bacterium]